MARRDDAQSCGGIAAAAIGMLMLVMAGCGSDDDASGGSTEQTSPPLASSAPSGGDSGADGAFILLDVDPCSLLTVPEIEAAIGSGVEQGGFGEDQAGRCTYSVGGDVGAGVVGIGLGDPLVCNALRRAIDSGGTATGVLVDVGQGGIVASDGGALDFLVGGGCVSITGSDGGDPLDENALVTLATTAAKRVG